MRHLGSVFALFMNRVLSREAAVLLSSPHGHPGAKSRSYRATVEKCGLALLLAAVPAFAADPPAINRPGDNEAIVSPTPMVLETEDTGVHGQLVVAPEILSSDTQADLIYSITAEPRFGRVGLAVGGGVAELFNN